MNTLIKKHKLKQLKNKMVDKKIKISVSVYKDSLIFAQVVASNKGSSSLYQELLIQKDKKNALGYIKLLPIKI